MNMVKIFVVITGVLYGRTSKETVTVVYNMNALFFGNDYSILYTSDKAGNAPYTFYSNPKTCPNPYEPEWYDAFLTVNEKVLGKRSVRSSESVLTQMEKTPVFRQLKKIAKMNGAFYQ